jgi:hypothetical protein
MQIYTKGSTRKTQKLAKDIVRFCAEKLMSKRLAESLIIKIEFHKDPLDGHTEFDGDCGFDDDTDILRPKEFTIRVNDNLRLNKKLRTLCHEMVHVKQFAKGEMRYMWRPARYTKFQGELYPEELDYWDSPWEIEAYGREPGLYTRWIDSRGLVKNELFDNRHITEEVPQEEKDFVGQK